MASECTEEYEVEHIRNKRVLDGEQIEYLIQWKGYGLHQCTWVPLNNLNCPQLIGKFETKKAKKRERKLRRLMRRVKELEESNGGGDSKKKCRSCTARSLVNKEDPATTGAELRDLQPSHVVWIAPGNDKSDIKFLMNWDRNEWVSAEEAHSKWPELVLDFYERRLKFT